ncbi:Re/Si-specific NAD(P)(+) transhydrogenase subunit alpha [bacterium]|nr:Re/Si-specific NAD(P)(+) transhydrogenase subunit alpha [bacterium]
MKIGVPRETYPGERRVALIPDSIPRLMKKGFEFLIESNAGKEAGFPDSQYEEKGATVVKERKDVFAKADVIFQVRTLGANKENGKADLAFMREGQLIIGTSEPLSEFEAAEAIAKTGAISFSLELIPRITRAQSMDVLSSMATAAGYKAVLWSAETLPKFFPMFMTAAGTIAPSKVFVIGAGVAGLQAIASAKRLGAVVSGYDVRPAVKEQVESLGAKFVEMELDTEEAQDSGGYAKALGEDFYRKQRELMTRVVAENDVVITTAAIPGKKAPILITEEMVKGMQPGSVIVDLAAERGGNCELTESGKTVEKYGVTIIGPENIPSTIPFHASQMFAKNIVTFFMNMIDKEGNLNLNMEDEIIRDTMVTRDKKIIQSRILELMGQGESTSEKKEG